MTWHVCAVIFAVVVAAQLKEIIVARIVAHGLLTEAAKRRKYAIARTKKPPKPNINNISRMTAMPLSGRTCNGIEDFNDS